MIASAPAKLLEGKKVLIVGIANDHSIAWGCALEHRLHLPRHAHVERHQDGRITKDWGELDFVVHSIAFSPKEALQSRVVDVERDGFLTTMEVSCWSFIRMARSPQIAQSLIAPVSAGKRELSVMPLSGRIWHRQQAMHCARVSL